LSVCLPVISDDDGMVPAIRHVWRSSPVRQVSSNWLPIW
jgi:hypothetical protein